MSCFNFTHPEDQRLGLPPSLRVERGQNTEGVMGVSQDIRPILYATLFHSYYLVYIK